jgi:type I restriction enzyme S subunit
MPKDIIEGKIASDTVARVSVEHVERLSRHKLSSGDIVYGRRGDIGRQALVRLEQAGWMCGTGCLRLSLGDSVVDPLFLHYYLSQADVVNWIANQAVGATMPNLNTGILRSVPIRFPSLPTQRRIAGILFAYDDLIENSQRRIKILESMARALYREWFVHFRFPGHESVPLVPSSLGEIPQGWEVKKLSEIAENFDRLRKPLSKMQRADMQGAYPYYGAAKVFDHVNDFIFDGEYLLMAEDGSVITPERNPVLQLVNEKFWPNNHTHVLRGRAHFTTHFLYLGLSEVDILPYITGAAQPKITQENMNRIPFFSGPQSLHEVFNQRVEPIFRQSQLLQRQIQNLRRTRDLLLPRLLTGQIALETLPGLSAVEQDSCLN